MTYGTFADHPSRKRSPEVDFGVNWRSVDDPGGYPWRVSWIERTGELYAVELSPDQEHRRVVVLGTYPDREAAEAAMRGWASQPMRMGPIANPLWISEGG